MAGGQERVLRRRIKSVQATKKITKAMELIAASRIVRAMGRINEAKPFYESLVAVVEDIAGSAGLPKSRYFSPEPGGARAIVVVTSDRGLCGSFNSAPLRFVEKLLAREGSDQGRIRLFGVGKKAVAFFNYRGVALDLSLMGVSERPTYEHARTIAASVLEAYDSGVVSSVDVLTTRFISAGNQRMEMVPLLPIDPDSLKGGGSTLDFEIEPSPEEIIDPLLRLYVEETIFTLLLEASASEYAYKQRAMKAATENAEELVKKYTRIMNRARQDAITTEIMEIVGGAEALKGSGDGDDLSQ